MGNMRVIDGKRTIMDGAEAICFRCRGGVVIGFTDRGAMLPLDVGPAETGALAVSIPGPGGAPRVRYLRGDDAQPAASEQRMTAHWDTHPACNPQRSRRNHARKHDLRQANGRSAPQGTEGGQRVLAKQAGHKTAPSRPGAAPEGSPVLNRDLTLDQLATADLDTVLARFGARPAGPGPFSSAI